MKLWDLSQTYARLNLFNDVTRETLLRAVDLFIRRANIENCEEVNLEAILRFKEATLLVAKGVSYNGYLRYLRTIGRHAVEMGYMQTNWFARAKFAPVGKPVPKTLDSASVFAAIQHIESNSDIYEPIWFWVAVIKFLWHTGMRRRQLVSLRIGDFDLESGLLKLSYEGSKTRREWFIPIHNELIPIIEHMFVLVAAKLGRSLKPDDTFFNRNLLGFRFSTDPGKLDAIPAQAITDFFKRIRKRTGIVIGAHRFRHSFATELCNHDEGPIDLFTVQHLLGHSALQTTRIYVQSRVQTMFNAVHKIKPLRLNMKKINT